MNKGLTLAEVLITIGIIGIVSAITFPIIISNTQDKQNIVHWRKMYSVISQAYLQTIEEGYTPCQPSAYNKTCIETLDWRRQVRMDETFIEKMLEKFHVSKVSTKTESWTPSYGNKYNTLSGGNVSSYNFNGYHAKLTTGEVIMFGGSHGGPWISVDLDGYGKGKDTIGKDVFIMKVFDKYIKAIGAEGTFGTDANGEICVCSKNSGAKTSNYIAGTGNAVGELISGACCSAYYLLNDK